MSIDGLLIRALQPQNPRFVNFWYEDDGDDGHDDDDTIAFFQNLFRLATNKISTLPITAHLWYGPNAEFQS